MPARGGIFNKEFVPGMMRDGKAEPQSLVSVPIVPGVNPKFLRRAYPRSGLGFLAE